MKEAHALNNEGPKGNVCQPAESATNEEELQVLCVSL